MSCGIGAELLVDYVAPHSTPPMYATLQRVTQSELPELSLHTSADGCQPPVCGWD